MSLWVEPWFYEILQNLSCGTEKQKSQKSGHLGQIQSMSGVSFKSLLDSQWENFERFGLVYSLYLN